MTKDRRLGRGLAALLGTPIEETEVGQIAASNSPVTHSPVSHSELGTANEASQKPRRDDVIRALNGEAKVQAGLASKAIPRLAQSGSNAQPGMQAEASHDYMKPTLGQVVELNVSEIDSNPFQPRRVFSESEIASLAESLKEHQQLQPVLVRRVAGRYQLISGERRLRAAIYAGMHSIRAEVREADDRLVAELAIVENLQRKDLNAIEKALSFKRYLTEHVCTQEDLAKRLKIDRSTIANLMRLLELPEPILDAIQADKLSAGHARALLPLGEESEQISMSKQIQIEGWSVRETERRVAEATVADEVTLDDRMDGDKETAKYKPAKSNQIAVLEQQLKMELGTHVEIRQSARGSGKILVHFANPNEFLRIQQHLTSSHNAHVARTA